MKTMVDVAKKANVSIWTVSRVINGRGSISQATREKVQAVIEKLGYIPDSHARMLKFGKKKDRKSIRKNCITAAISGSGDINSPVVYGFLAGISKGAGELGLGFFTDSIKANYRKTVDLPPSVKNAATDGIIVIGRLDRDFIRQMKEMQIPVVVIGNFYPEIDIDRVFSDDIKGSKNAVKYLIEKGHRKIGHLRGPEYSVADNRLKGYRDALLEGGIEYNEDLIEKHDFLHGSAKTSMSKLLDKNLGMTAVFCWSDWTALGAKEAIEERGLKIPDDISLIGYDNIDVSSQVTPGLTTMDIPRVKIGSAAIRRLNDIVNGIDTEPMMIELPVKVVERNSVKGGKI